MENKSLFYLHDNNRSRGLFQITVLNEAGHDSIPRNIK